jgi:hypothetical protein
MLYLSVKPLETRTIYGTAIDDIETIFREDCYQYVEINQSETALLVMAAIPPFSKVLKEEFDEALRIQFAKGKAKELPKFFESKDKKACTFSRNKPSKALVTEYKLSQGTLISESIYLADNVCAEQYTHKQYNETVRATRHTEIVANIISTKQSLHSKFNDAFLKGLVEESGISAQLVYGTIELFNHMCRHFARNNNIPFVGISEREKGVGFRISNGYANFNRAFRDPCAFVNMSNIVHFLSCGKELLTEEELRSLLPR